MRSGSSCSFASKSADVISRSFAAPMRNCARASSPELGAPGTCSMCSNIGSAGWGKRLEMLKEAIPSTAKAVFLGMREGWEGSSAQVLRDAAGRLGISLAFMLPQQGTPSEIERVFAAMEQQRPDAVLVSGEGDLYANRKLIAELAEKNRLPAICPYRDYVEAGGLMAYAVDLAELLRRMADDVHQILKGAKPGDIPIYQATKFELLINLKTAKTLGLTLPSALLARADEVIE